jgi:glycerate kinase
MRILCAPDSFKGSVTAGEAAAAMAAGVGRSGHAAEADVCPVADGGEGTLATLAAATGARIVSVEVTGPLGRPVTARYGVTAHGRLGIVELAEASGLGLVPEAARDPGATTTFGTGELIAAAVASGCRRVLVAVGGSATCDGGAGLLQALGARFLDTAGRPIDAPLTADRLTAVREFEPPPPLPPIEVACDVTNPLLGPGGAAAVYAPQKGAGPDRVPPIERALAHLARVMHGDPAAPGAGAAGGAGYGLAAGAGATLRRGIDLVLDTVRFADRCRGATLVLTGEGRVDGQTRFGKACFGVATAARRLGVPTVAIAGGTGAGWETCLAAAEGGALAAVVSLTERFGTERARAKTAACIAAVAAEVVDGIAGRPG